MDPQTTRQLLQVAYARMWRHNMVSRGVNRSAAWRKGMSLLEDLDTGQRSIVEFSSTAAEKRKRNGICAYCAADATTTALARRPDVRAWDANGRRVQSRPKLRASSASRASRAQTSARNSAVQEVGQGPGSSSRQASYSACSGATWTRASGRWARRSWRTWARGGRRLPAPPKRPQRRARRPTPASAGW